LKINVVFISVNDGQKYFCFSNRYCYWNVTAGEVPGPDGITAELHKAACDSDVSLMRRICTEVWPTGAGQRNGQSPYFYPSQNRRQNRLK